MEGQLERVRGANNGPFTVLVCSLLTLCGIVGLGVGIFEFGLEPAKWSTNAPNSIPVLVSALLDVLAAFALGFGRYRRAVHLLVLALVCRVVWTALANWGWADTGGGTLEVIALLLAWWLERNSQAGPNNSVRSFPSTRGA